MENYNYHIILRRLWEKAVKLYEGGNRDAGTFFNEDELRFLNSIGHTAQEVYDFAEDWVSSQEPDLESFLMIADIRRHYFKNIQKEQWSSHSVDTDSLPPKTDAIRGIEWLPRIIQKAKAKLHGEMSPDLMFSCGGDRNFFKTHDIHPAEFLRIVEMHENNEEAIIDWVAARSEASR